MSTSTSAPDYTDSFPEEPRGPEPQQVATSGGLRASDDDREQVSTLLSTAYAEGRITRDEHDERLGQVLQAKTFDDLVPLTADLVPSVAPPSTLSTPTTRYDISEPTHDTADRMVAVFGGVDRRGRWRMRRKTSALALFGGIDLDLREATFEGPVLEMEIFCCFGGMDLKVPEGIEVRDQTVGIFGGTEVKNVGEPQPGAPVLVLKGGSLFGGISVKGPRPSRQERKARRSHGCH